MAASCVNRGNISTTDISLIINKNIPTRNVSRRTQSITSVYNGHMSMNVRESQMNNPEKLAANGTQDEEKQNKNTTQCVLDITRRKQTQIT